MCDSAREVHYCTEDFPVYPHCCCSQGSVAPLPPLDPRGETHSLAGEGVGGPNSVEGTDTQLLYLHHNPSTQAEIRTVEADKLNNQHRHISLSYATPQQAPPHPNEICYLPRFLCFAALLIKDRSENQVNSYDEYATLNKYSTNKAILQKRILENVMLRC